MILSLSTPTERVARVRELMRAEGLQALIVRATDRWLNEYVPHDESTRIWLTGFSGSTGDALLTLERGWVAVDGRYTLQAEEELADTPFQPEHVPLGTSVSDAVAELARRAAPDIRRLGYEPHRTPVRILRRLEEALQGTGVELVPTRPSLIERAWETAPERDPAPVRAVGAEAVGRTVAEKVAAVRPALEEAQLGCFLVQRLDELAYLCNLRGEDFPFQATFRGLGFVTPEAVILATEPGRLPEALEDGLRVVGPDAWPQALPEGAIGYDPAGTTAWAIQRLQELGHRLVSLASPLSELKARKTPGELELMRAAFQRADRVVAETIAWLGARLEAGARVSEADLAAEVERRFLASGAVGLSFRVIAAAGANGAIVHYSTPDPERVIAPDELVLLDTGAYYAEGYATDLTRTFIAGSPAAVPTGTPRQRAHFTRVLRAAIAGMSARVPAGTRGEQLDAIVRAPLWAEGFDYRHGTGHGVGINVHESPPRIATKGKAPLAAGQVFSIEPGVYLAGKGGVRIENLCTIEESRETPEFLEVVPLTFCPLDERLIDRDELSRRELRWLDGYLERCARVLAG